MGAWGDPATLAIYILAMLVVDVIVLWAIARAVLRLDAGFAACAWTTLIIWLAQLVSLVPAIAGGVIAGLAFGPTMGPAGAILGIGAGFLLGIWLWCRWSVNAIESNLECARSQGRWLLASYIISSILVSGFAGEALRQAGVAPSLLAGSGALGNSGLVGTEAPTFAATTRKGKPISLRDYRGKVVLLDFWATWCGPCMREAPNVKEARRAFRAQGFEVISISLDRDARDLDAVVAAEGYNWPQIFSRDFTGLPEAYGVKAIPQTFLIDRDGTIIAENLRGEELHAEIAAALERQPPVAPEPEPSTKAAAKSPQPAASPKSKRQAKTPKAEAR